VVAWYSNSYFVVDLRDAWMQLIVKELTAGMIQTNPETALRDALTAFETSVTAPVVSGELSDWIDKVKKSWRIAAERIGQEVKELHPQVFGEIAEADAALLRQVELLRAEDEAIAIDLAELDQTMSRLVEHLPKMEPDEAKAQPHIQKLGEKSVALVTRVRKQDVAVKTWFAEAFNRERGGGD
jgi:hypothetical protein